MSLQLEKLENNMAKLTIEVSAEELEKAIEKVFQKYAQNKIFLCFLLLISAPEVPHSPRKYRGRLCRSGRYTTGRQHRRRARCSP